MSYMIGIRKVQVRQMMPLTWSPLPPFRPSGGSGPLSIQGAAQELIDPSRGSQVWSKLPRSKCTNFARAEK